MLIMCIASSNRFTVCHLWQQHGMHTTLSALLAKEACVTVGFKKSICTVTLGGTHTLLSANINHFIITCANQQVLDTFRAHLLDVFEDTYEGA